MRTNGKLIFLCLITELCLKSGIEYHIEEGLEKNLGDIDLVFIQRFYSNSAKTAEAGPSKVPHENIPEQ